MDKFLYDRRGKPLSFDEWSVKRDDAEYCRVISNIVLIPTDIEFKGEKIVHPVNLTTQWLGYDPDHENLDPGQEPYIFSTSIGSGFDYVVIGLAHNAATALRTHEIMLNILNKFKGPWTDTNLDVLSAFVAENIHK